MRITYLRSSCLRGKLAAFYYCDNQEAYESVVEPAEKPGIENTAGKDIETCLYNG